MAGWQPRNCWFPKPFRSIVKTFDIKGSSMPQKEPSSIAVEYWKLGLFVYFDKSQIHILPLTKSAMQTQWSPKRSSLNSKGTSKIQLIGKQILKIDDQVTANLYFSRCDIHGCIRHSQNHPDKRKMEINDRMLNAVYFNTDPIVERSSNACFLTLGRSIVSFSTIFFIDFLLLLSFGLSTISQ